jgi:hypothetical protein
MLYRPNYRQRVTKHIPATSNTSVAMQRAVDTTIHEDVFSVNPPRDYISSPAVNQEPARPVWRRGRIPPP